MTIVIIIGIIGIKILRANNDQAFWKNFIYNALNADRFNLNGISLGLPTIIVFNEGILPAGLTLNRFPGQHRRAIN